jgi:HD superfamily phosphohydrolase
MYNEYITNVMDIFDEYTINTKYKTVYDTVHGYIYMSDMACIIIDTPEFQRLRKLHQLGTCNFVFPSATQTRLEHSMGTYHLAGRVLNAINDSIKDEHTSAQSIDIWLSEIPELNEYFETKYEGRLRALDEYICELIKIAALCHDIGHGPFSHVFDDVFMPSVKETLTAMDFHENRSGAILEHIIKNNIRLAHIIIDDHITFMKNLINPNKSHCGFVYQIVSNNLNSLDVDKYDYIARDIKMLGKDFHFDFSQFVDRIHVIDNIICYPKQVFYDIASMFYTRYRLHKQIYSHKTVIAVQFMINEIMILLDPILNISSSVNSVEDFCKLTDEYIISSVKTLSSVKSSLSDLQLNNLLQAEELINKLEHRQTYSLVDIHVSEKRLNLTIQDFKSYDSTIDHSNILIYMAKIGLVSGDKKNPLDYVSLYNPKQHPLVRIPAKKEKISCLLSTTYQEYICMIFYKQHHDFENIEKTRIAFQKIVEHNES